MRIFIPLFSPPTGTWGGLTRVIAFAEAAEQAGHALAFSACGELAAALAGRGYRVYEMPKPTLLGLPRPLARRMEKNSQRLAPPVPPGRSFGDIWFVLLMSGVAVASYMKRLLRAELDAAADFQPQAMFTDLDPAAFLLARKIGLPIACTYAAIAETGMGSIWHRLVSRGLLDVQRAVGLPPTAPEDICFGPDVLKIVPSVPALDGADPSRADVCYVGYLIGDMRLVLPQNFSLDAGRRYVFVYTGTGSISLSVLERELPQVFPAGPGTVCLVGGQSIRTEKDIGNVRFAPFVPAQNALPYCEWSILHAGQNSIAQSMLHGVPVLAFPGPIFERRHNARRLQEAGAGRMCELPEFRAERLRLLLENQQLYAERAAKIGKEMRALGGAEAAVRALEAWTAGRMPHRPR